MKPKIYLAGGFKGGWHSYVIENLGTDFTFYNPEAHQLKEVDKYTSWDLYHVEKCDILLGYMSSNNPSGYGLALEIGFAKAKNKLIILVDERSDVDPMFKRYFDICNESSSNTFKTLDGAIQFIKSFNI